MLIRLENVTYVYKPGTPYETTALQNVTVEIPGGQFVGLIGPTGSGKSTLVQHLNGLLRPTSGKVYVNGVDLSASKSLGAIRRKVGLVFQYPENQLFEETVYADVAFGPRNMSLPEEEVSHRVRRAIVLVGLDFEKVAYRSPFELSGGQMRRVALAGVLAMEPEVLILDEPTAGLDPAGKKEILSQLVRIHREDHASVMIITHDMDEVARLAERILVMHGGRLVLDGPPRQVFSQPTVMQKFGLEIPQVSRFMFCLRERELPVRTDVLTVEEARDHLLPILRKQQHA